jgi:MOSC domain-containing protein YiiM/GNAT superfamily N-acetyltransferase
MATNTGTPRDPARDTSRDPDWAAIQGRVLQVSVSGGGVPKKAVERAHVGRFGLTGDRHNEDTLHGGPHRAVCLFGMEVIERLQSEGHPVEPGSVGENLTTWGIEWSLLPVGTRALVGDEVELELASSTTPCATQTKNFADGNFNRILIDRHPSDSRMYARVLREGEVRTGDPITILPPTPDSRAFAELMLKRLDRAETKSSVAAWKAAADAGYEVDLVEDGELAMSASAAIPGPAFNQASGLARLPNLLSRATRFYDRHGTTGYLWLEEEPWPNATVTLALDIFGADAADVVPDAPTPDGVVIREIGADEAPLYTAVRSGNENAGGVTVPGLNPWPDVYRRMAATRRRRLFIAEINGEPVGNGSLHISAKTGWLRGALVSPQARGRGIQRALIAARIRAALEAGCDLVGASAEPGEVSARNLERMGLRKLGSRSSYHYMPVAK